LQFNNMYVWYGGTVLDSHRRGHAAAWPRIMYCGSILSEE
jgi:hypothetical protein